MKLKWEIFILIGLGIWIIPPKLINLINKPTAYYPFDLKIDANKAWLQGIRRVPSPNYSPRPKGMDIELLVIHSISLPPCSYGGPFIEQLFTRTLDEKAHPRFKGLANLRVSSHLLIRRTGEIVQYVSFLQKAWHAGISNFRGRKRCNDFSIGLELEGCKNMIYTNKQYEQLERVIKILQSAWPILTHKRIVGHSDIAPGRKTDPGPSFNWKRLNISR
jgi:AmpD protein